MGQTLLTRPRDDALRHRQASASIRITVDGAPLSGREVRVAQTRHAFLFGSGFNRAVIALASGGLGREACRAAELQNELSLRLFNTVTLPFYWSQYEPEAGRTDFERMLKAVRWYRELGSTVKGHPLCWHTLAPQWLLSLDNEAIRRALLEHVERDTAAFAGQVALWDVVNEGMIAPVFDRRDNGITRLCREMGVVPLIAAVFERARAADPGATLLINDFDVSPEYERLIADCLDRGVPIDAIGIQSHMHQGYWGVERTQNVLERFSRFGLPLHFTESTLISGELMPPEIRDLNDYRVDDWPSTPEGEARQCEQAELHYRTLFAHPSVQSITWWELVDGGWLKAPAGLVRRDLSPKPAYDKLVELIQGQWWTRPIQLTTSDEGMVPFVGFLGDYELSFGARRASFSLTEPNQSCVDIAL